MSPAAGLGLGSRSGPGLGLGAALAPVLAPVPALAAILVAGPALGPAALVPRPRPATALAASLPWISGLGTLTFSLR